ncbi:MAG: MFS transporter [Alphaproteobacteria bacterium]|nr:MFS transporter [Alphaproteobacteria bacterium]MAS46135.1 MFS transporter [Alphaproteobacteria bacterium]MAX95681.1 MFS transporter [Alphaproteobacteria bacterium]MBN54183.1 MFS transporter [Alphaproteobacteria bacterium]OUT42237.1 MAG: MFS transporter [Micavibrio sp. TMED2]|tara:strand:- start:858 stop:3995 length:3138 start_codon:yes stop_codon:yes gene_type:complete
MSPIDLALSRSRTVILTLILLLVTGAITYQNIPKESDPDINIPIIYVSMTHEGISPEDAERLLLRPMEKDLNAIDGVEKMTSNAYQGGASIQLEFDAGFDADQALTDVRDKVDEAKVDLPEETDEPTVSEVNFSLFPVLVVQLSGLVPERTLLRIARDLRDELEAIPSVLEVKIGGDREEAVEIVIDPLLLESYELNGNDILATFNRSNRLVAAGNLDTGSGRFAVKVPGLFETARDIWDMPVKVEGDAVIRVRDVADIRRTFKDPESFARVNGQPALTLEIVKRTGENIIETIDRVKELVETEKAKWPDNVVVGYSQDRSTDIKNMLTDLQNNVISAVLLVMIVCIATLGVRSALLVGVAIPGSFLTGILVIATMGLTINIVVLFALILAVGILVDGAIVVTEYANRRLVEGASPREAYREAAKRMAWPIFSSTITTLAAFLPLLFWPDVVGEFMRYLPITLIAVLAASLLMALVFVPTVGATIAGIGYKQQAPSGDPDAETNTVWVKFYLGILNRALKRPALILLASVMMLVGTVMAYGTFGKGVEFFPDVEPQNAVILVHARGNLSIWEKDALMREVEDRVLGHDGLKTVYTRTGSDSRQNNGEDVIGQLSLEFEFWRYRDTASAILADLREQTADLAGINIELRKEQGGPSEGKAIDIELSSLTPDVIEPVLQRIRDQMETMPGLVDIEDSRPMPGIEWKLNVDRPQAAKFGVDVTGVGDTIRLVTNGLKVGEYRPDDGDDEIDIQIRYPSDERSISQLDRVRVASNAGMVPISNFVERVAQPRVGIIERRDGQRVFHITADVAEGLLVDDQLRQLRAALADIEVDPRVNITFRGEDEDQREAGEFLSNAFAIALFLIAIILVTQFNSFSSALMILSTVIMSTIGVLLGLLITGQPFGIVMCGVGVIALAGIVVNNNIVLIDTFDHLYRELGDYHQAILETCRQRLRPVMLTTITTILGLLPMVLSINIDFVARDISVGAPSTQWWVQLATSIVFGLAFSTLLTLIVTPSALMLRGNLGERIRQRKERKQAGSYPPAQPAE